MTIGFPIGLVTCNGQAWSPALVSSERSRTTSAGLYAFLGAMSDDD